MSLLDLILNWFRHRQRPRAPLIEVRTLAQSMTVTWTLPTKYTDGSNIVANGSNAIASSEVAISADNGTTWTVLANVLPNATQTLNRPDLADGTYKLRILEVTVAGTRGVPAIGDFVIRTLLVPNAPVINGITVA